jgi:hypothetical protein
MDIHDSSGNLAYRVADKEVKRPYQFNDPDVPGSRIPVPNKHADELMAWVKSPDASMRASDKFIQVFTNPTVRRSAKLLRRMGLITRKQYLKRKRRAWRLVKAHAESTLGQYPEYSSEGYVPPPKIIRQTI